MMVARANPPPQTSAPELSHQLNSMAKEMMDRNLSNDGQFSEIDMRPEAEQFAHLPNLPLSTQSTIQAG